MVVAVPVVFLPPREGRAGFPSWTCFGAWCGVWFSVGFRVCGDVRESGGNGEGIWWHR